MSQHPPDASHYFRARKVAWRLRSAGLPRLARMAYRRVVSPAYMAGICLWLIGCSMQVATPTATPIPTATPADDGTWNTLSPGIERRVYRPGGALFTRLTVVRLDLARVDLRVHYRPGEPLLLSDWRDELPEAALIFNTNFFDRFDQITGLLFVDGVPYGDPYRRRGGTFYVDSGMAGIQSNLVRPYAGEQYNQAVQAFPMLVTDGAQSYFDTRPDRATRRTVVGVDREGRVLVMVTSFGGITLLDLAQFLATSDMELVDALNLDGGGSSMLAVRDEIVLGSFDPVPAVMAAYPR